MPVWSRFVEPGVKQRLGRPAEHRERLVVLKLADVVEDHDRVDTNSEGERGAKAFSLLQPRPRRQDHREQAWADLPRSGAAAQSAETVT